MAQVEKHSELNAFLDSVFIMSNSNSTRAAYRLAVNKFQKFLQERYQFDEIELVHKVKKDDFDVYKILGEFVVYLTQFGYKPKSLRVWLPAVNGYLRHLGIKIYREEFNSRVRMPKVFLTREEGLSKETILRVLHNSPPKLQTAILVAVATGMRLGEIVQIKISDVDFETTPTRIKIRAEISKGKQAREVFLTLEATKALKDYLGRFFGWKEGQSNVNLRNTIIFGRTSLVKTVRKEEGQLRGPSMEIAANVLQKMLEHTLEKIPELNIKGENDRKVIHFHAFRKYFRTVVGNEVNRDFAEALMGHRFYLDTYYALTDEKRQEMYLKAEPYLTISDFTKIEKTLKGVSEKQKEIEERLAKVEMDRIQVPDYLLMNKH